MSYFDPLYFLFLGWVVAVYRLAHIAFPEIKSKRLARHWISVASCFFLLMWSIESLVAAVILTAIALSTGRHLNTTNSHRRLILILGISLQVAALIAMRLFANDPSHLPYTLTETSAIRFLGCSYIVLQNIGFVIESYYRRYELSPDAPSFFAFSIFFPKLAAGPVEVYGSKSGISVSFAESCHLIAFGLFKHLVVSNRILEFYHTIESGYTSEAKPLLTFWTAAVMTWITSYCDFSAIVDIGRGSAGMLGVSLPASFNRPYLASNPIDYWSRWNFTITEWMRRYIYLPSLLKWKNVFLSTFLAIGAIGTWHGLGGPFAQWSLLWIGLHFVYILIRRNQRLTKLMSGTFAKPIAFLGTLFIFHFAAVVGLLTVHTAFFPSEYPQFTIPFDQFILSQLAENLLLWCLIAIVPLVDFVGDSVRSKPFSSVHYFAMASLLGFLTGFFAKGSSYLFYYLRF